MKMAMRYAVASLSLVIILAPALIATRSFAQTPRKLGKEQLVGHWQLVSVAIHGRAPYGDNPQGSMFFDSGGHYSVIVISGGRANDISYFGTYTVEDANNTITLRVDASSGGGANVVGRDVKRLVTIDGDQLIVVNELSSGSPGGVKVTWKRAN